MIDDLGSVEAALTNRHDLARSAISSDTPALGYVYDHVPPELIEAAGAAAIRVAPYESRLEAKRAQELLQTSYTCSFITDTIEAILREEYSYLDGLVTGNACSPLQRFHEGIDHWGSFAFTHYIKAPADQTGTDLFQSELERFRDALEMWLDSPITDSDIETSIEAHEANRSRLQRIETSHRGATLSGTAFIRVAQAIEMLPAEGASDLLNGVIASCESRESRVSGTPTLVTGCSPTQTGVLDQIEAEGGLIVADDIPEAGRRLARPSIEPTAGLSGIADRYLGGPAASYHLDFDSRLTHLESQIVDRDIKKIVALSPQFCDPYRLRHGHLQMLADRTGCDLLTLDVGGTGDESQRRLRIQSFYE